MSSEQERPTRKGVRRGRAEDRAHAREGGRVVDVGVYRDKEGRYRLSYRLDGEKLKAQLKDALQGLLGGALGNALEGILGKKEESDE